MAKLSSYPGVNVGNTNMYALNNTELDLFLNDLWTTKIYGSLFVNTPNRSALIYNILKFPFPIINKQGGGTVARMTHKCISGIRIGDQFVKPISNEGTVEGPYIIQCLNSELCKFTFERTTLNKLLNNNFSDYGNISEYLLYLPYIGYINIDSEILIHAYRIIITYLLDCSTGRLCAISEYVYNNAIYRLNESYNYCAYQLPFSGTDSGAMRDALLGLVTTGISVAGILSGKPYVSVASESIKNTIVNQSSKTTTRNPTTNRQITQSTMQRDVNVSGVENRTQNRYMSKNQSYSEIFSGLNNLMNCRIPTSLHSSYTSADCWITTGKPFIIAKKPEVIYSTGFDKTFGRPLWDYKQLKTLKGFTKLSSIHLNISCLQDEIEEIETLLINGVILNTDITPPVKPEEPATPEPEKPEPTPELPEGEKATMLCCFNGKFKVTGMRGTPAQTGRPRNHYGLDIVGLDSNRVYAISSGWVKITDTGSSGLGKCVHVQMDDPQYYGQWILYGHLSSFAVANKQYVNKGQLIGIMGNTGESWGTHTHLEWRNKYDRWDSDFTKYDICKFTGIPNTSVDGQNIHIGSPIYKTSNGASVQKKLGLEDKTIQYLENYEYAEDLMRKIDENTK